MARRRRRSDDDDADDGPPVDPSSLEWPSPELTPRMEAFFDRVVAALRADDPDARLEPDREGFRVRFGPREGEEGGAILNLTNMYEVERSAAIARARGEDDPRDAVADVVRAHRFISRRGDMTREELLASSKPALLGARDYADLALVRRELRTPSLHMAYVVDFGVGVSWITEKELAAQGLPLEELHEAALANLGRAAVEAGGLGEPGDPCGPVAMILRADDGLASSRVFDARIRQKLTDLFPAGYRFVVPARDTLLALSGSRLDECEGILATAREEHATAAHPLSPSAFAPGELALAGGKRRA